MIFSWFDASAEKEFGASLADFFMERSPLGSSEKTAKFVAKKQEELLGKMSQQIMNFKLAHKLNIYKKAQIGNVFKWRLKDAGYDPLYVDQLTSWLMLRF
jgi:hypothetical protein